MEVWKWLFDVCLLYGWVWQLGLGHNGRVIEIIVDTSLFLCHCVFAVFQVAAEENDPKLVSLSYRDIFSARKLVTKFDWQFPHYPHTIDGHGGGKKNNSVNTRESVYTTSLKVMGLFSQI